MATKAPMLDMFKKVLPAADTRNKDFYDNLSDEEKKGFSPWLIQRYLSSVESPKNEIIEHYLTFTNDMVNVDYSTIKDHPELMWKLMSLVGYDGDVRKHPYIAPGKGKKKKGNAFKLWLHDQYPHLNEQEIEVWFGMFTKEQAKDMLEQYQVKDKDVISGANDL
jgi:hypothetical protein